MTERWQREPFTSDQDHDTCVENGRKGGIASAKARKKRKLMREFAAQALDSAVSDKLAKALAEQFDEFEIDTLSYSAAIVAKQVQAAIKGDLRAAEWLRKLQEASTATDEAEADALTKSLMEEAERMEHARHVKR